MEEDWKVIEGFENYSISELGRVRNEVTGRVLVQTTNQYGVVSVGLVRGRKQHHRSVALLVANAFLERGGIHGPAFDTPIHLDGDRGNNSVDNLRWRPRWFAVKYNRQFREPYPYAIHSPIQDIATHEVSENSIECAKAYGVLEAEIVSAILSRTYVWPTYQQFRVLE